jgi:hypothetical protein
MSVKKLPLILVLFFWAVLCRGQGVANVQYTFTDFTAVPQQYQLCSMTPLWKVGVNGQTIIGAPTVTLPTGTNGSVVFSNVWMGASYLVQLRGYNSQVPITAFTNAFPASLGGSTNTIDGSQWTFYTFVTQGGVMWTNIAQSNLVSFLQVQMAVSNGVQTAELFSMTNGNTNQYLPGSGMSFSTNGNQITLNSSSAPASATNVFIGSGNTATLTVQTNSPGSFTLLVPIQTGQTNGLLAQAELFSITNGQSAVSTNLNNSLVTASNVLIAGITNALGAVTNQSTLAQSNAQVSATNLFNLAMGALATGTNAVLGQASAWLGTTNSLATTNLVIGKYVTTNQFTAGTNAVANGDLANLQATNTALNNTINNSTNVLTFLMTSNVEYLQATLQPKSGLLTGIAGTGAMTNGITAGQNTTLTTNGLGQTVVNATNQSFLIAGLATTNALAQYMGTNASTNFYPMASNPSNYVTATITNSIVGNPRYQFGITNTQPNVQIGSMQTSATGIQETNLVLYNAQGLPVLAMSSGGWIVLQTNIVSSLPFWWWMLGSPMTWTSDGTTTNFQIQGGGAYAPWLFANQLRGPATNQFDGANSTINLSNAWNLASGNTAGVNTNRFDTNGAALQAYTNAYTTLTNFANTNAQALIAATGTNYVASTNGAAHVLTVPDILILNGKTNFIGGGTSIIGVIGNFGGTYQNLSYPLTTVWTNIANSAFTIIYSFPGYFQQSNGVTMYSYGSALGAGTPVNGPFPAPYASFGGFNDWNGFVWRGWISSTNLTAQIQDAGAIPVLGIQGIKTAVTGGTNLASLDTNFVIQLIGIYSTSPTNGVGSNFVAAYVQQVLSTNQIANVPIVTNGFYTNTISPEPVIAGNSIFIETNSSAGGTTANAMLTNNPNATMGFSNALAGVQASNVIGYSATITNLNTPKIANTAPYTVIQLPANVSGNQAYHVIIGSGDNAINDNNGTTENGVGIIGGNSNAITGVAVNYDNTYIFGGSSNLINAFTAGTYSNNVIEGSVQSVIYGYSGLMNNNAILNSFASGISNQPGGILDNNWIIGGIGNEIGNPAVTGLSTFSNNMVLGSWNDDTNNNCVMINAGVSRVFSLGDDTICLNAANGVFVNGLPFTGAGIPLLNGTGTNTTVLSGVSITTTNLSAIGATFLNASNLDVTFTLTNALQGGYYPWGLIPSMNWSNNPSGLAWAYGNFSNAGAQQTNAWGAFTTNGTSAQVSYNAGFSNIISYSFPTPVIASGESIVFGGSGINDFAQIVFQYSADNVNWTTLAEFGSANIGTGSAWTNYFSPISAQYYRWSFTNGTGSGTGTVAVGSGNQFPAQLYGPNNQFLTGGNGVNNMIESGPSTLAIDATNGATFSGPLSASQITVPTVSTLNANVNGNVDAQSYTLNGIPLNFGAVSNATVNSYSLSGLISFGTVYGTNMDGVYVPSGTGYYTNSTTGYGDIIPYTYTNVISQLYVQVAQQLKNAGLPVPPSLYQLNLIVTNINTIGFGASSNLVGLSPSWSKPVSLVGLWSPANANYGQPLVSVLSYTAPASANVIVTSSNATVQVGRYTNGAAITYDLSAGASVVISQGVATNTTTVVTASPYIFIGTNYDGYGTAQAVQTAITSSSQYVNAVTNTDGNVSLGGVRLTGASMTGLAGSGPTIDLSDSSFLGVLFNGAGEFGGTVEAPSFAGVSSPAIFTGNGGALTSLNANNISSGVLPLFALPNPVETNFDSRGWTNSSASGVTANLFNGTATNTTALSQDETNLDNSAWVKWKSSQVDSFNNIGKNNFLNTTAKIRQGQTFTIWAAGTGFMSWLANDLFTNFLNNFPCAGIAGGGYGIVGAPSNPPYNYQVFVGANSLETNCTQVSSGGPVPIPALGPWGYFYFPNTVSEVATPSAAVVYVNYPFNQFNLYAVCQPTGTNILIMTNGASGWVAAGTFSALSATWYTTNFTVSVPSMMTPSVYNNGLMIAQSAAGTNYSISVLPVNTTITNGFIFDPIYAGGSGHFDQFLSASNGVSSGLATSLAAQLILFQDIDSSGEWITNGPQYFYSIHTNNPNMDVCVMNIPPQPADYQGGDSDSIFLNSIISSNAVSSTSGFNLFDWRTGMESTNNEISRGWTTNGNGSASWPHVVGYYQGWDGMSAGAYMLYKWMALPNYYYSGVPLAYVQEPISVTSLYNSANGFGGNLSQILGGTGYGGSWYSQINPGNGTAIADLYFIKEFQNSGLTNIVVSGNIVVTNTVADTFVVLFQFTTNGISKAGNYGYIQNNITLPAASTAYNSVPFSTTFSIPPSTLANMNQPSILFQNPMAGSTNLYLATGILVTNRLTPNGPQ